MGNNETNATGITLSPEAKALLPVITELFQKGVITVDVKIISCSYLSAASETHNIVIKINNKIVQTSKHNINVDY